MLLLLRLIELEVRELVLLIQRLLVRQVRRLECSGCSCSSSRYLLLSFGDCDEILQVPNGHFNDFSLLNSTSTLLHIMAWNELTEIGQTVVHPVSAPFFNNPVRCGILLFHTLAGC